MSPQEILALAQQGHPIAVATLLSYVTRSQNMTVRVQRRSDWLHILLESDPLPHPQRAGVFMRCSLQILNVQSVRGITVYGCKPGSQSILWQQAVHLDPSPEWHPALKSVQTQPQGYRSMRSSDPVLQNCHTGLAIATYYSSETRSSANHSPANHSPANHSSLTVKGLPPHAITAHEMRSSEPSSDALDLLARPKALVLIVFAGMLLFWDAYLKLLDEIAPSTALSTRQLAQRLGINKRLLRRYKHQANFSEWTRKLDPEGVAWTFQGGVYVPKYEFSHGSISVQ